MDANFFSLKSQTLTLTTSTPSLSFFNSLNLRPQFLRPPNTSRRKKCNRLGLLHTRASPQFLVRASLHSDSNSIFLVVAFAISTFTAVAYFNHFFKINSSSKQVSGSSNNALSQLGRSTGNHTIESHNGTTSRENEYLMENVTNQVSKEENAHHQIQESSLVHEGSLLTGASNSLGVESLVSSNGDYASPQESEATALPIAPHVLPESSVVQPLMFANEMPELQLEKDQRETYVDTELPELTVNITSIASLVPENNAHTEVDDERKSHQKLVEEDEITTFYGVFQESVREEQYTFHGANQSVLKPLASLAAVKAISSHASPMNSYSLFSLKRNTEIKGAELSVPDTFQTAEYVEEKITLSHKGGASHKRKGIRRGIDIPRNEERVNLVQENGRNLLQFPYPNGMSANDTDFSEQLSVYNRLLRVGRLTACVDLLEDLERRGLLDMNKVYHSRFFNTCKSQRATKEAFRFFKLISNPTLSAFNMLMSVCASSQDSEGAFQVLQLVQKAGLKADCKLYTTLISTCAKSGKVDAMFEVFHEMVNARVEPNVHTYGALIDGCAKAGQVAKAFGAYGIMRSKNVKPDRVVFNALITACGQSGAVDRAFDVLAEMNAETRPIDPDHITVGALIKACANAGQVDRAQEVYKMIHKYNIKGTPEVYTIALNCCSQTGDWEFARSIYSDVRRKGVVPDEVFLSALIDVAGHAGKVEAAFEILEEAKTRGMRLGIISYSSLMGACSNAKNWQKALELYENMKSIKLNPTVSIMNALLTALCDGDQLLKAMEILSEMKRLGLCPNSITYSILLVASEKKDDVDVGLMLLSQAKEDGITPNLIMFKCVIGMCLRRFEKAHTLGEHVLSFNSGQPQIENKWYLFLLQQLFC
ncbi:pentatricopeptide repeat-containing protein MRL1, chloroplastic-like [Pistacia vera]|uniref:pentatricopeptide repeat-containing protein MRL1, chloroplastic-like n=1 Tax=Pistacia vera TaxID=55513 RepID=UPI0012630228|nr:pentatricopeptide repeat-containing protein MRL1, chloroplastic-like [Pistacia vera]